MNTPLLLSAALASCALFDWRSWIGLSSRPHPGSARTIPIQVRPTPPAFSVMHSLNPAAFTWMEHHSFHAIEDVEVCSRWFRIEYISDSRGASARAYVRHNPMGPDRYSVHTKHLFSDGRICLGKESVDLKTAVQRARYWCIAYVCLRETGRFPNP